MRRLFTILCLLCLLLACGKTEPVPSAGLSVMEETAQEEPALPGLMDAKQPMDESGTLWYVPNDAIESGELQELCICRDMLLAYGYRYNGDPLSGGTDLQISLISQETGLPVHEIVLSDVGAATVQICGDLVAVCDNARGYVYLLDETLHQTNGRKAGNPWETIFVSTDGTTAYCFPAEEGIRITDLETGEQTVILESARVLFTNDRCGSMVSFGYVDLTNQKNCYAVLNLDTGMIDPLPFDGSFSNAFCADGIWLASLGSQNYNYYLGRAGEDPAVISLDGYAPTLLSEPVRLQLPHYYDDGSLEMFVYDIDGDFLSACRFSDAWNVYVGDVVWSEHYGGYFFTCTDQNANVQLMFWDLNIPVEGDDLASTPLSERIGSIPEGSAVSQSLYDRAAALSEEYGVSIKIADQCATEYMTYTVQQNTDYWQLSTALDALENVLSMYPNGFFEQLCYSTYQGTEFNLVGTLTPLDLPEGEITGFDFFVAFVEHTYEKHIVVLDVTQSCLEDNLCHELSHIIDDKLTFDAKLRKDALFDEEVWADYNPEDFGYVFDYYNIPDVVYTDGYDSYFIDVYSRTFPTEDRARIFEYAMAGWDWMFTGNEPLQAKLAYYAACIRDAFDTTGWPDTTAWEQPLNS